MCIFFDGFLVSFVYRRKTYIVVDIGSAPVRWVFTDWKCFKTIYLKHKLYFSAKYTKNEKLGKVVDKLIVQCYSF